MSPQEAAADLAGLAEDFVAITGCDLDTARAAVASFVAVGAFALLDEADRAGADALREALVEQASTLVKIRV